MKGQASRGDGDGRTPRRHGFAVPSGRLNTSGALSKAGAAHTTELVREDDGKETLPDHVSLDWHGHVIEVEWTD